MAPARRSPDLVTRPLALVDHDPPAEAPCPHVDTSVRITHGDVWPLVGVATLTPDGDAVRARTLRDDATEAIDCGRVSSRAPLGGNWYGFRVVTDVAFARIIRAQQAAARRRAA